ncbi:hypothetical protein ILYODFUR_027136 [Ilyodon furcidens]|uniref:Uncharacterized protein n=1 Tax=Ilyodon furcidens TaxID=33524 RepID=A0ABV0VHS2_9TELE
MQQLNSATTWGSLTGLGGLTPQYLAVRVAAATSPSSIITSSSSITPYCSPVASAATVSAPTRMIIPKYPASCCPLLSSSFLSYNSPELFLTFIFFLLEFRPIKAFCLIIFYEQWL